MKAIATVRLIPTEGDGYGEWVNVVKEFDFPSCIIPFVGLPIEDNGQSWFVCGFNLSPNGESSWWNLTFSNDKPETSRPINKRLFEQEKRLLDACLANGWKEKSCSTQDHHTS